MLFHHQLVIHFVDVVAGENQHVLGLLRTDGINVLIDRVGGALIPGFADAFHRRQDFDELAHFAGEESPAFADVAVQGEGLVLRQDVNPAQVGINAVGKGYVDNAVNSAEGHGGFGAVAREGVEPFAGPSSQQDSQCVFHGSR